MPSIHQEPAAPDRKPHTLILDGIWGAPARWEPLRKKLSRAVGPSVIWPYNSSGTASLEQLAKMLAADLLAHGAPLHLVGYSMGGLIVREALRQNPRLPVRSVALLHTPHYGSLAGYFLPLTACREMRPGSSFLRRLNAAPWPHRTLVTWCPWDLMVLPGHSACWKMATRTIRCDLPAHNWPILSSRIHAEIVRFFSATACSP